VQLINIEHNLKNIIINKLRTMEPENSLRNYVSLSSKFAGSYKKVNIKHDCAKNA